MYRRNMRLSELKKLYPTWAKEHGRKLKRWNKLDSSQRWFVFVNSIDRKEPLVSDAKTIAETPPNMVWSKTR